MKGYVANFPQKNIAKHVSKAELNTLNRSINSTYKLELIPSINAFTVIANAIQAKKLEREADGDTCFPKKKILLNYPIIDPN